MTLLVAVLSFVLLSFTPQTPPPTPMPDPTGYPGENCIWSTGATLAGHTSKIHSGYVLYCAMPDPDPAKAGHFDTSDCLQYSTRPGGAPDTYCAITPEVQFISGGDDILGGLPAWVWILVAVVLLIMAAKMFGPKSGGWRKTNVPGVMARDPNNRDSRH